jgi:hypothetical protein
MLLVWNEREKHKEHMMSIVDKPNNALKGATEPCKMK